MRISDWSSDVCSSDLFLDGQISPEDDDFISFHSRDSSNIDHGHIHAYIPDNARPFTVDKYFSNAFAACAAEAIRVSASDRSDGAGCGRLSFPAVAQIGRAEVRERVCEKGVDVG